MKRMMNKGIGFNIKRVILTSVGSAVRILSSHNIWSFEDIKMLARYLIIIISKYITILKFFR